MKRRSLLAGASAALSSPIVGCLGDGDRLADGGLGGGGTEGDDVDALVDGNPEDYPVNSGGLDEYPPEETHREVDVGSRDGVDDRYGPHGVLLWTDAADLEIDLRVVDAAESSVVYRERHALPADAVLSVRLLEPSLYLVEVRVSGTETRHTVRVPCSFFDCNSSSTRIGIDPDRVRSSVFTTLAGCPSAEC